MKKIFSILVLASVAFTSCKKEETAEAPPTEETAADTTAVTTDSTAATATAPAQVQPAASTATGSVMTANPQTTAQSYTTTTTPAVTAKGMNPAHGQPGHRCDIAVGAPLNSPPGKKAAAPVQNVSQSTTVTPAMLQNGTLTAAPGANVTTTTSTPAAAPSPVVTAPGMNPPHGQEGHVCSVAVGAPLPKKE